MAAGAEQAHRRCAREDPRVENHLEYFRSIADRYRRLAQTMSDPETIGALESKAAEFEDEAERLQSETSWRRKVH